MKTAAIMQKDRSIDDQIACAGNTPEGRGIGSSANTLSAPNPGPRCLTETAFLS
jgi:hypothetical protein